MFLSPPPKMQFFSDAGIPLAGGLIYTYGRGTTDPLATYLSADGSTANSNPIVLDSQGRATIWLQMVPYTFIIHNSIGELQGCSGDIEPSTTESISNIPVWSDIIPYSFPDKVAGTDGYDYRCIGTNIIGVDPVTDDGTNWTSLTNPAPNPVPIGSIIAWQGGYYTNGSNGNYTNVLGNTAVAVNAVVNPNKWYVCDGAQLNLSASPIYNAAGRYLPNLTDNRFLMGAVGAGVIGGSNDFTHSHTMQHYHATSSFTLQIQHLPLYASPSEGTEGELMAFVKRTTAVGGGQSHNHGDTAGSSTANTGASTRTDHRPVFLACWYLQKAA